MGLERIAIRRNGTIHAYASARWLGIVSGLGGVFSFAFVRTELFGRCPVFAVTLLGC